MSAIEQAGYTPGEQIAIALDPASSEFYDKETGRVCLQEVGRAAAELGADGGVLAGVGGEVSDRVD